MVVSSSAIAQRFVERICAHDVAGLTSLMTPEHVFVDSLGQRSRRPEIEVGWRQYFHMVPDYWIKIDRSFSEGGIAILVGAAGGTFVAEGGHPRAENRWETPAVWVATVENGRIAEWRIYADNEPIRERMRRSEK